MQLNHRCRWTAAGWLVLHRSEEQLKLVFVFREVIHSLEAMFAVLGLDDSVSLSLEQGCDRGTYEDSDVEVPRGFGLGSEAEIVLDFNAIVCFGVSRCLMVGWSVRRWVGGVVPW